MGASAWADLQKAAGPVSRETFERLQAFEQLFLKWNRSINLAAPSTLDDVWRRHILDSAQLARIAPAAIRWVDLGSGGGFPGLVLGFLLAERPGASIDLVESNRKKASFLQSVIGQFDLPARVLARRIDDSYPFVSTPEIVTARALAALPDLLDLSAPWLSKGARALFHKGRDYRAEVEESTHRWAFDLVEHPSMTDPHGIILEITDLRPATPQ
ncbi:16S rRNA (guanine(527)-N(7))-methyltransferase RsmG [Mesorhizobium sp. M1E.F.Ca.ET.045.02.1.1]|uniref:16S rRNA (guanine(527)-N(7))-methyltransferase RsmG n=1 Tax=unclassified Mesorhizobium TaxID=325217 RepID=UPI000F75B341|nr:MULTISPECIES: 16S rRNA (guanine(527)-N(7))-methyltransferase RsmG [unclassified Mesorhizobium]AZO25663.1 16S rRNA (guanine(527)-N(7))-methyltransferase RsmG [Mesorhizobium sp. M1E.F.Ca.ET.045.02.1.1]RUW86289.1 16S rRNA (guanine(527)-N(7))-methyltransferase RsmG [Mesorhizobium sp. M1E.F.Ca.ET.063.01.1.1]RWB54538.1 MAG: 16S rRNA (guanine(527)-N(7))-methyltransferase RsmG [Mesorhizobium sp.]